MIIPQQQRLAGPPSSPALLRDLQSEVSVEAAPLLQFIVKYAGLIVAVLVLFVAVLAGTAGYTWYSARAATTAQMELASVILHTQGAERVMALEHFALKAPSSVRTAAWLALADAATEQQDFVMAGKAFAQVAAADPQGAVGLMASLNEGQALLRAGHAARALEILEKLESHMPEGQRPLVQQILAEAALNAEDKARAIKIFEALAAASTGAEVEYYRFRIRGLEGAATSAVSP